MFGHKSISKIQNGIFDGPEIRRLFNNSESFIKSLSRNQKQAFESFKDICLNFLGKNWTENYKEIAKNLVLNYEKINCTMSYKLHIIDAHLDSFPPNCSHFSDEMGERFHQDFKNIEKRYQGRFNKQMLSDIVGI